MNTTSRRAINYARQHQGEFLEELKELIRIPSVSSDPRRTADVRRCARLLADKLRQLGLVVRIERGARHPIVLGRSPPNPRKKTVLVYAHYDVQPADPVEQWSTPPFSPVVAGGALVGRGASDDKGPLVAHTKALESYIRGARELPTNIVCVFEGEEETGSAGLATVLAKAKEFVDADVAIASDTRMLGPGRPTITEALRGILNVELTVKTGNRELHSGAFGGAIENPLQILCEMIAELRDPQGRIRIRGFYDRVRRPSVDVRRTLARDGPKDEEIIRDAGAQQTTGEPGYSLYERATIRPAFVVSGIAGGYAGPGVKGVVPPWATAKINFRLVPDQEPSEITEVLRAHFVQRAPRDSSVSLRVRSSGRPLIVSREHPGMRPAARAITRGFGTAPVFVRSGGSIPAATAIYEILGIAPILIGFALPDDGMHATNERMRLANFFGGIETAIWFLHEVGSSRVSFRRPTIVGGVGP